MSKFQKIASILIPVSFLAGLIAHFSSGFIAEMFVASTPPYLLILSLLVLFAHQNKNAKFLFACLFIYVAAMAVEICGVATGFPFGVYQYGEGLGPKVFGVPWVIGFNWFLLVYAGLVIAEKIFKQSIVLKLIFAAGLVLLMDFFIEKVAPSWDYWYWESDTVPFLNYAAWFLIAFCFQGLLAKFTEVKENRLATITFVSMLLYFILASVLL